MLNNPLGYIDRNGKWPTGIHNEIIKQAFPGLSAGEILSVQSGSLMTDVPWTVLESHANYHAMRRPEQTVEQARAGWQSFIDGGNALARAYQEEYEQRGGTEFHTTALQYFGSSSHAVMDNTSPAHAPFQLYDAPEPTGIAYLDLGILYAYKKGMDIHSAGESTITPSQMGIAVQAVRENFRRAFGDERYRRAVPAIYEMPWTLIYDANKNRAVNAGNLGTVTIYADDRQVYQGPLKPVGR
ncbi:MAG: hypothetical protein ACRD9R_17425 [Pyrinomonadaceae bacterium]